MLSLILKGTNACNLRCRYCSLGKKEQSKMLGQDDMLKALCWFLEYAKEKGQQKVGIILHGGEPFLIPAGQYRYCFHELLKQYKDMDIHYFVQTNGYELSEEYMDLILNYKIRVGVSLDGDKDIHDRQRMDIHGNPTFEKVMGNIHRLKRNSIPVSVLMVVTRYHQEMDFRFFDFLAEEKIPIKINPLYQVGEAEKNADLAIPNRYYGQFLIELFDYLIEHKVDLHISPLEELLSAMLYAASPRGCNFCASCIDSFLCVNQEGDLYPCGRFSDYGAFKIGDIHTGISAEGRGLMHEIKSRRAEKIAFKCRHCRYLRLCYSGCSAYAFEQGSENMPSGLCGDYYMLFEYLSGLGLMKYKQYLLNRKSEIQRMLTGEKNGL